MVKGKPFVFAVILGLLVSFGASTGTTARPPKTTTVRKGVKKKAPRKSVAGITYKLVLASEVKWEQLNPKRGDKSPKAGTLWGDRKGTVATGFLVTFLDGFRSPPHIHNVSYRGVVIRGLVHNDDPKAAEMWMPTGSFWTQPKGEVHITAARGRTNVAFIEIERGPYLVHPAKKAFDSRERPVNLDPSNIVWLDASNTNRIKRPRRSNGPKIAFLWGKPQNGHLNGTFVKLSTGSSAMIRSHGSTLRAVAIQGRHTYRTAGKRSKVKILAPGSYFTSTGKAVHHLSCDAGLDCIVYVRIKGGYDVIPSKSR